MRKRLPKLVALICAFLWGIVAIAQNTVTGKVISPKGDPLSNVNVQLKGTNVGTTTGEDGSFSLNLPVANNFGWYTNQ
jgi:hypothetical protein